MAEIYRLHAEEGMSFREIARLFAERGEVTDDSVRHGSKGKGRWNYWRVFRAFHFYKRAMEQGHLLREPCCARDAVPKSRPRRYSPRLISQRPLRPAPFRQELRPGTLPILAQAPSLCRPRPCKPRSIRLRAPEMRFTGRTPKPVE
jgi:hypothetical protein